MYEALDRIHGIITNEITSENIRHLYDEAASLSVALDELDKQIMNLNASQFNETRMRLKLETQLENIISAVALMADSESTRPNRRDRIVNECNVLRQALQDLLNAYTTNNKCGGGSVNEQQQQEVINMASNEMNKLTRNLRRLLRKAVIDHISDSFIETNLPLEAMIEASKRGDEKRLTQECVEIFLEHGEKLVEVSSMACSMSANNVEGIKLVRMASMHVQCLAPQLVNAARIVCARPASKVATENMDVFRDAWLNALKLLTDAVDDITLINDFLAVTENHILDDLNRCVMAVRDAQADTLDRTAGAIRGRCARLAQVVGAECDLYETDDVINKIVESVCVLRDELIPSFAHAVQAAVSSLQAKQTPDDNRFIEAARLVYDGVHDVRNAVLMLYDSSYAAANEQDDDDDDDLDLDNHNNNNNNNIDESDLDQANNGNIYIQFYSS